MERKTLIICGGGILLVLMVIFLPGYSKLHKLREKSEQYRQRIFLLEEENKELEGELEKLQEDPHYIEKKARKKLGILRKGEMIYRKKPAIN
ncbi:MAG: septum formation initiator family protein [Candidatus Omnitrophota bacterium]